MRKLLRSLKELLWPDCERATQEGFDRVLSRVKWRLLLLSLDSLDLGIKTDDGLLCFSARSLRVQYIRATDKAAFRMMSAHALSKGVELADLQNLISSN